VISLNSRFAPHDTCNPLKADCGKYPQSIRALRTAPGFSKLIAYLMTYPGRLLTCTERVEVRVQIRVT
jgi:hypothetical protein